MNTERAHWSDEDWVDQEWIKEVLDIAKDHKVIEYWEYPSSTRKGLPWEIHSRGDGILLLTDQEAQMVAAGMDLFFW